MFVSIWSDLRQHEKIMLLSVEHVFPLKFVKCCQIEREITNTIVNKESVVRWKSHTDIYCLVSFQDLAAVANEVGLESVSDFVVAEIVSLLEARYETVLFEASDDDNVYFNKMIAHQSDKTFLIYQQDGKFYHLLKFQFLFYFWK